MDEEESTDTIPIFVVIIPPALLALVFNYGFTPVEILWAYSIFLEAVAILPQLWMLRRTGQCEALTRYYILCLGGYRAFYIGNWIWRYVFCLPFPLPTFNFQLPTLTIHHMRVLPQLMTHPFVHTFHIPLLNTRTHY